MGRYSSSDRYDDRYDDRRDSRRGPRFDTVFIDDMKDLIGRMLQDSREDRGLISAVMQALDYRRSDSAAENCGKLYNFIDRFVERTGRRITDELPPRLLEDALDDWLRGVVPRIAREMRDRDDRYDRRRDRDDRYDDRRGGRRDRGGGRWDYSTRYDGSDRRDRDRDDRRDSRRDRDRDSSVGDYSLGVVDEPPTREDRTSRSEHRYSEPQRDAGNTVSQKHSGIFEGEYVPPSVEKGQPSLELTLDGFGLTRERLDDELALKIDELITVDENVYYHGKHAEFEAHASLIHVKREVADVAEALAIADDAIPDELRKGEYLHVIDYDELALVNIPTSEFEEVRARVREEYTANKQWSVLLKIRGKMSYDSGTALDKFLTAQINAMLLQYFRVDSVYARRIQIDGLNDLKGLMDGEFGLPHKDIKDWKTLLSARLEDLIDRVFITDNSYVTVDDEHMGDIVKVKGYNLIVNKVSKVDLGFVDQELKDAWVDQFFKTYTVVRMNRRVAVSNILNHVEVHHNGMAATNSEGRNEKLFWMTFETVDRLCRDHHVDRVYFYPDKGITETPLGARFVMYPVDKNGLVNPRLVGTETFCNGEENGRI